MAPRKRSTSSAGLPDNLYSNGDYYRYKHPQTGKFHGMGDNKADAILAAKKLNAILLSKTDLVRAVLGEEDNNWTYLVARYITERQADEGKKASTVREENYRLNHIAEGLGKTLLSETTQRLISDYLNKNYTGNSYTKHRGTLIKLMSFGIATGMFPDGYKNLAEATLPARTTDKVRRVLTMDDYKAIHEEAEPWLKVAMDFSLITLQRRSDSIMAKYSDIKDGELYIIQAKTEKHGERAFLRIKIGVDLAEVIAKSRAIGPVCPFIIHRKPDRDAPFEGQEHWAQVRDQYLTKAFNKARDRTKRFDGLEKGQAPTFHEIRALGGAEYLNQGHSPEYVNLLMGHTTQRMTDSYTDQHLNWTECAADLRLKTSQESGN